jgi:hypothetical protein
MDDETDTQAELTAEVWDHVRRLERRIVTLHTALKAVGTGQTVTSVAEIIAEESVALLQAAAKAEGYAAAVAHDCDTPR